MKGFKALVPGDSRTKGLGTVRIRVELRVSGGLGSSVSSLRLRGCSPTPCEHHTPMKPEGTGTPQNLEAKMPRMAQA